jgi:PAS domain S-box-containing protein
MKSAKRPKLDYTTLDLLQEGVWVSDSYDKLVFANAAMAKIAGVEAGQIIGRELLSFPEETLKYVLDYFNRAKENLQPCEYKCPVVTPSGIATWQGGWMTPLVEKGRYAGMICTVRDITDNVRSESELRSSESRFRNIFSNDMVPMAIWTNSGGIVDANNAMLSMLGYSRPELAAGQLKWDGITPDEYRERDLAAVAEVNEKGCCEPYAKQYRHKDGHLIPILIGGGRFADNQDQGVLFAVDMTIQKQAEMESAKYRDQLANALRASEELNRSIFQAVPMHVVILDDTGRITSANHAWQLFAEQNGAAGQPTVMVGANYLDVCRRAAVANDPLAREALIGIESVLAGRKTLFSMEYPCHSLHEQRWFEMTAAPLREEGQKRLVIIHTDITQRVQTTHTIEQSNQQLELALLISGLGTWDVDRVTGKAIHDARYCAQLGFLPEEFPSYINAWLDRLHPDDLQAVMSAMQAHERGDTEIFHMEYRVKHKDGHWVWIDSLGRIVLRNADGTPLRIVGTTRDITAQKRIDNEGTALLRQIETMIGNLSRPFPSPEKPAQSPRSKIRLSGRNREVLQLIAEGKTSAQIAKELGITEGTAASHRRNVMHKLGLKNKAEVVRYALKHGIVAD